MGEPLLTEELIQRRSVLTQLRSLTSPRTFRQGRTGRTSWATSAIGRAVQSCSTPSATRPRSVASAAPTIRWSSTLGSAREVSGRQAGCPTAPGSQTGRAWVYGARRWEAAPLIRRIAGHFWLQVVIKCTALPEYNIIRYRYTGVKNMIYLQ